MRSFAIGTIFAVAAGLVVLSVEAYNLDPGWLIVVAVAGIALVLIAVLRD